jgi:hypothetical protein
MDKVDNFLTRKRKRDSFYRAGRLVLPFGQDYEHAAITPFDAYFAFLRRPLEQCSKILSGFRVCINGTYFFTSRIVILSSPQSRSHVVQHRSMTISAATAVEVT